MTDTLLVTTRTQRVINNLKEILQKEKNLILYGPPGTGKTWLANRLAKQFTEENDRQQSNDSIASSPFHQSFGYEEFIEGIRPIVQNEQLSYEIKAGIFKRFCNTAKDKPNNNYVFIIDEINRGDIARIFGECITLLEKDKRDTLSLLLPYSQEPFTIPQNVYIIGTMNAIDRTARSMDYALRRRFAFQYIGPNISALKNIKIEDSEITLDLLLKELNKKIRVHKGRDYRIGHAYFMNLESRKGDQTISRKTLDHVFNEQIIPLLGEYFFHSPEIIKRILGDKSSLDSLLEKVGQQISRTSDETQKSK